jgi:hypothetical protein
MRKFAILFILAISTQLLSQVSSFHSNIVVNGKTIPTDGMVELEMISLSSFQLSLPLIGNTSDLPVETRISVSFPQWQNPMYVESVKPGKSISKEFQGFRIWMATQT